MPSSLSDQSYRDRIGPYAPKGLPSLVDFEPNKNFLVRASAGAGKTTALIARIEALVRTGVSISDITAITFTRKAAGEMKARLFDRFQTLHKQADDPVEAERLQRGLDELSQCFVGTIHSFCARLLKAYPLHANVPPDFEMETEDRRLRPLRDQAWYNYVEQMYRDHPEQIEELANVGYTPADLRPVFKRLSYFPELTPYTEPTSPPALDESVEALEAFIAAWTDYIPTPRPEKGSCDVMDWILKAKNRLQIAPPETLQEKAELIKLFESALKKDTTQSENDRRGKVTLKYWEPPKSKIKSLRDNHIVSFVERHVEPVLTDWNAYAHRVCTEFASGAVEAYANLRRERGVLSSNDVLRYTRNLLRDHPTVRNRLHDRFPCLLVDEFQDTDPLQAEILFYLTGTNDDASDWTEMNPEPGSLFVVGDDKQSIYRFRRADIAIFNTVADRISAQPYGEEVTLTRNFRSLPALCDAFDATFKDTFAADRNSADLDTLGLPADAVQAEYTCFDAEREEVANAPVVRQKTVEGITGNTNNDIASHDAEEIAWYIHAAINQKEDVLNDTDGGTLVKGKPSDFMILTRNTTRLSYYAEALAKHNIPYTIVGGKDAHESTALRGLMQILNCVFRPNDALARLAYLRGPVVGFSDADLYALHKAGMSFGAWWGALPDDLDPDLHDRLSTAYAHLETTQQALRTMRPAAAIEQMVDTTGLFARAASDSEQSSLQTGRFQRVLEEIRMLDAKGESAYAIWQELEHIAAGDAELDGLTLETGTEDAVRLLNVHQAKGMEANVVFLADPYGGPSDRVDSHVCREGGKRTDEIAVPLIRLYDNHPGRTILAAPEAWETFEEMEMTLDVAEEHRLQYVAATRAKQMLVVSRYLEGDKVRPWQVVESYCETSYVPNLDPPVLESQATPQTVPADLPERLQAQKNTRQQQKQPSYERTPVSGLEGTAPGTIHTPSGAAYSNAFGTVMHNLFEQAILHRGAAPSYNDRTLSGFLEDADLDPETTIDRLRTVLNRFLNSRVWSEVQAAKRVHTELPLGHLAPSDTDASTLHSGIIDLIYLYDGRWQIVDFKSDGLIPNDSAFLQRKVRKQYTPQIRAYVEAWKAGTRTDRRVQGALWFADVPNTAPYEAWQPIAV